MRVFLSICLCLSMVSCFDEGDCVFTATNMIKIDFMDVKATKTAKPIIFDSIRIFPNRGFQYLPDTTASIEIPADPATDETAFVMYHDFTADTIVFGYSKKAQTLSPDCGTYTYFNDLSIKHNTFPDSTKVINPSLRTDFVNTAKPVLTNVQIFH